VGSSSTGGAAYTTGEVNLTTGDRPLRVRSISVDAHLLKALSIQPEQGRFFGDEETARWTGTLPPPIAILSHELWRTAFGQRPLVGLKVEIEGRPHEIVGIMPPGADVMDNHTQVWRSEEHTSELQSRENLVCRLLLEKKKPGDKISQRAQEKLNALGNAEPE